MNVGDMTVERETESGKRTWGTVVYVHPLRRFYTVAFEYAGGVIRECFAEDDPERVIKVPGHGNYGPRI